MNAIISVSDKTNVLDLALFLTNNNFTIYSTGGTYKLIKENIPDCRIVKISDLTNFPEILNGRVKTLHPRVYGGLLADPNVIKHVGDMNDHDLPFFHVVAVNLYPFERVSRSRADFQTCIENIDIGGVSLIRASSKNFKNIVLLCDPQKYTFFMENYSPTIDLGILYSERQKLAIEGFKHTSNYDDKIHKYLLKTTGHIEQTKEINPENKIKLKYGLNPQQQNSYLSFTNETAAFTIINGILGYINVLDILNGWLTVMEADDVLNYPAAISMKHTSLAGLAIGDKITKETIGYFDLDSNLKYESNIQNGNDTTMYFGGLAMAFMKCRMCDPLSSFGDFICLSRKVDLETAKLIKREVCDGIAAPDFDPEAYEILKSKKGGKFIIAKMDLDYYRKQKEKGWKDTRTTYGVTLEQDSNMASVNEYDIPKDFSYRTDLVLANIALKYAQSNNISIGCGGQIIGMGCGQQNRVNCVNLAGNKSNNWLNRHTKEALLYWDSLGKTLKRQQKINLLYDYIEQNPVVFEKSERNTEIVLASDGFFPFSDNIVLANKFKVKEIIQPGGSVADNEIIEECNKYDIKMYLSGSDKRMFFH
jgi:phosphoribosylaminoimidazolecarboxamide formyltransferase / IMP cyclohydrolase